MTGFNVSEFKARTDQRGWLHNNKFLVEFSPPPGLVNAVRGARNGEGASSIIPDLSFLCEASNLPGISISTSEIRRYGYGNFEKKPHNAINNDVVMSFLGDGRGDCWNLFKIWLQSIVNFEVTGAYATGDGPSGQSAYEVSYKDSYAADVRVTAFDQQGQPAIAVTLREAFPIFLGDVQLNWGDTNSIVRFPVTFTFFSWHSDGVTSTTTSTSATRAIVGDLENFVGSVSAAAVSGLFGNPASRLF